MAKSKIEWTDYTFNPWRGDDPRVVASEAMWEQPVRWNRWAVDPVASAMRSDFPRTPRVFCASLGDVFEDWDGPMMDHLGGQLFNNSDNWDSLQLPNQSAFRTTMDDVRPRLFELIDATPNLDWLLLTKRPENVRRMWKNDVLVNNAFQDCDKHENYRRNVWLGTSVASQKDAEKNIPELLKCRDLAPNLFLSVEPLIGPVDLSPWFKEYDLLTCQSCGEHCEGELTQGGRSSCCHADTDQQGSYFENDIDWVIVGGESGPNARPCNIEWIQSIADQCDDAGVPLFVKQDHGRLPGKQGRLPNHLWNRKEFPCHTKTQKSHD